MTGPENYALAEELLSTAPGCICPGTACIHVRLQIACAQAHATLALAAATALGNSHNMYTGDDEAWHKATSAAQLRDASDKAS